MHLVRRFVLLLLLLLSGERLYAQSYSVQGHVVDDLQHPIEAVTCILQHAEDSTFVQHVLSDQTGTFSFENLTEGNYLLYLYHMSYEPQRISLHLADSHYLVEESFVLPLKENRLDEIVVTAEQSIVKIVDQKLVYNVETIRDRKIASNAFDLLRYLPSMMGDEDDLKLVGAVDYAILIDGRPSTLSKDQIIHTLKGLSASRVDHIEIMYSAPPQYHVRGAAINVVLKQEASSTEEPPLQGEVATQYQQGHYPGYGVRSSLFYQKAGYAVDLTLGAQTLKEWYREKLDAVHLLQGDSYGITQDDHKIYRFYDLDMRLNVLRTFKTGRRLSLTYTGNLNRRIGSQHSNTLFVNSQQVSTDLRSRMDKEMRTNLHNLRVDYTSAKQFSFGVDYTLYYDPTTEVYNEWESAYPDRPTTIGREHGSVSTKGWFISITHWMSGGRGR